MVRGYDLGGVSRPRHAGAIGAQDQDAILMQDEGERPALWGGLRFPGIELRTVRVHVDDVPVGQDQAVWRNDRAAANGEELRLSSPVLRHVDEDRDFDDCG